jgi:hypothetical protein
LEVAELYDRQTGAAEQTNRAAKHPNKLAEMRKLMLLPNRAFAEPGGPRKRSEKNARFSS